jgi:ABC-2 type transport system permease protein
MREIARYEGERRLLGSGALAVGLALFAGLVVALAPSIIDQASLASLVEAYPETVRTAFNIQSLGSLEGFLAAELYQFAWVILLGLYLAYSAASTVAGDVEHDRMDTLLSAPVSRASVVTGKFLSLLVPILAVNVVVGLVVYGGALAIDEPIPFVDVVAVHALSIPYLLCCAAVGLVLSVLVSRESLAQRGAIGILFGLFLLDAVLASTEYAWLGALAPMRYYDPTAVLVGSRYDWGGAAILLSATVVLVALSALWFRHTDVR